MLEKSETLLIGFDCTNDRDLSCLAVSKITGDKLTVTKLFYGQEAEEMYNKLTTK